MTKIFFMFSHQLFLFKTRQKGKTLLQHLKLFQKLEEIELFGISRSEMGKYYKYSKYDV